MEKDLESQLVQSIFQFKKLTATGFGMEIADSSVLNMNELMLMNQIADNELNSKSNIGITEVGKYLAVSKPAISQMLNSLEKKGFIERNINKNNRRNVIITLTDDGLSVLNKEKESFSINLKKIISKLGESDVKKMIAIVNRMIDITNELNND